MSLLRYAAVHGKLPETEEEWRAYRLWRSEQISLPECRMGEVEGHPDGTVCERCAGRPDCPKANRRTPA
jgi:hypothetical protein